MLLKNKKILVTGASRGIGRGCALELARAGADIGINFRSHIEEAEELANEIRALGQSALILQADVADQPSVERMVEKAVAEWGRIDGLISNAAYSDREPLLEAKLEGIQKTIDVSMWGQFYALHAVAKQLAEQGSGGAITIISSPHAYTPIPSAIAYNMAKAAVDQMARTAAIELAPHRIRVNIIHPGWIDTPGERKFFTEEQLQAGAKSIPWGRMGQPEEIGRLAAFMMSDQCDYMTGSAVLLDGGVTLPWWSKRSEGKL